MAKQELREPSDFPLLDDISEPTVQVELTLSQAKAIRRLIFNVPLEADHVLDVAKAGVSIRHAVVGAGLLL